MSAPRLLSADIARVDAVRPAPGLALGRLAELGAWLAGVRSPRAVAAPARFRCLVLGTLTAHVAEIAGDSGVGLRGVPPDGVANASDALASGVELADGEIDGGADVLVIADPDAGPVAALVVAVLTGAEPVALLPRGAAAIDTADWIARASALRDERRRLVSLRGSPADLLDGLGHPALGVTVGLVLRAAERRTAVLLDGTAALAAALLVAAAHPRARDWWQVADSSPDPVHARAVAELAAEPILRLGTSLGDGTAGVLAAGVLRAAVTTAAEREGSAP